MRLALAAPLLLGSSLCCGCSATGPPSARPMPFHVALAPVQGAEVIDDYPGTGLRLDLDERLIALLNENLASELRSSCFAQLTVLDPARAPGEGSGTESTWLEAAGDTEADLLISSRLRHSTSISEEVNPAIHSMAPFSWIPGPQLWPVPDKKYSVNCSLTVNVYDLSHIAGYEGSAPVGIRHWYFTHTVTLDSFYLTYFDRVGWNLHYYVPSLLLPCYLLDLKKAGFQEELNAQVVDRLAERLALDLQSRSIDIVRNEHEYGFFLEDERTRIEYEEDDYVRVTLGLRHRIGKLVIEPEKITLVADSGDCPPVTLVPDDEDLDEALAAGSEGDFTRYTFSMRAKISDKTNNMCLSVVVGSAPEIRRSFTLALPPPPAARVH